MFGLGAEYEPSMERLLLGIGALEPDEATMEQLRAEAGEACRRAAAVIRNADVLLLCTGAGFSADSGLAVYEDVARVKAYADLGLTYHDVCRPDWLREHPELFWGFWGQCFNDYRSTAPHEGYEIVDRWASRLRDSTIGATIRERTRQLEEAVAGNKAALARLGKDAEASDEVGRSSQEPPFPVEDVAGGFFAFTSNVDAHHYDWFRAGEIRECHGNVELFQCHRVCSRHIWRAPLDHSFQVERTTMLAPSLPAPELALAAREMPSAGEGERPHVGGVRRACREHRLRYMRQPAQALPEHPGFKTNHPRCSQCGRAARPAILMFEDICWEDNQAQSDRWEDWLEVVKRVALDGVSEPVTGAPRALRFAVLEVGSGDNVPTVRKNSEHCCRVMQAAGANVRLIRVNPELPLGDSIFFSPGGPLEDQMISIPLKGLDALRHMDAEMLGQQEMRSASASSSASSVRTPRALPGKAAEAASTPSPPPRRNSATSARRPLSFEENLDTLEVLAKIQDELQAISAADEVFLARLTSKDALTSAAGAGARGRPRGEEAAHTPPGRPPKRRRQRATSAAA